MFVLKFKIIQQTITVNIIMIINKYIYNDVLADKYLL